jgi:hypothetical protein
MLRHCAASQAPSQTHFLIAIHIWEAARIATPESVLIKFETGRKRHGKSTSDASVSIGQLLAKAILLS